MKNLAKLYLIAFISIILFSCSNNYWTYDDPSTGTGNSSSTMPGMPFAPGKCYAKCLIQNKETTDYEFYYRYTGQQTDLEGVEETIIMIEGSNKKWVKKKADRNCLSANPEDCLVWCLVDVPGVYDTIVEVLDTALVKDFIVDSVQVIQTVETGGYTEWKEIVCDSDITEDLYRKVQQGLVDQGYQIDVSGEISGLTKTALVQFQKENGLPIGALDFETLEALGVDPP